MEEFLGMLHNVTESHYGDEGLKATNLHDRLSMSRSALHYKLKKHTGQSTGQYLSNFRIKKAKVLLSTTHQSIKLIAFQVGFKDPNYFSRVFKKQTGLAPRIFRLRHQNEQ